MLAAFLHRYGVVFRAAGFVLICLPLIAAAGVAAQAPSSEEQGVADIALSLALDQTIDAGTTWVDEAGLHVRGLTTVYTVEGDLSGTATLASDLDWGGPCDASGGSCEGGLESFASIEIESETATWRGSLAIEQFAGTRTLAHGILIGRHGAADQVLVIDEAVEATASTLALTGSMATLEGPIGGIQLSHSACITGETTADGGFIGGRGLIQDSGPARITRQEIGSGALSGVYGSVTDIGQKGTLRGIFIAKLNNRHAHGSFVLVGESGPYQGLLGYGRATMALSEEPRCESGLQATSTWTGQARYLSDPDAFLAPRVYFASPTDQSSATTPVALDLAAEHVTIEPAGAAREGAGYLVVIIDAPCIGPGEPIPMDEQHIHLAGGETSTELNLFSGEHRLCLQLANGEGIAQPATDVIMVTVVSSGGDGL